MYFNKGRLVTLVLGFVMLCYADILHNNSQTAQSSVELKVLLRNNTPVRKARILFASQDVAGPILNGGIGTAVRNLASTLAAFGHNVSILYSLSEYVCPNNPRSWNQWQSFYLDKYGVTLLTTPREFSLQNEGSSGAVRRSYEVYLWLQAHESDYDFVHFPEWQGTGFFALLAKKQGLHFASTVLVVQAHSPSMWSLVGNKELPDELGFFDRTFMERKSVELADYLISPSKYMLDWMISNGWVLPSRTFVHPNTRLVSRVESKVPHVSPSIGADTCRGPWEFVFFGRLEERKGVFVFIDAVKGLLNNKSVPPFAIHIVGKVVRAYFSNIKTQLSLLGNAANITLHTSLGVEESRDFLKASPCRVAVMPSLYDNLPYTVMECLINRVRFITSNTGGAAELIHPSMVGLLTFFPSAVDLQRKLDFVLHNGLPFGEAAKKPEVTDAVWSAWHDQTFPAAPLALPRSWHVPFVSVIMTTFNREASILLQAVFSLQQQDYPSQRFDVILVNDAGTSLFARPDLGALRLLFREQSWQIVELENNLYLGAARNEGVRRSKGQFLLFMDDDNIAKPNELRTFASVEARTRAKVLTCHFDSFDTPVPLQRPTNRWIPTGNTETSWAVNSLGDANFFTSRATFDAVGGFTEERLAFEDWEFLVKAHLSGNDVQVLPEPLFWKRQSNNSMLHQQDAYFSAFRAFRPYLSGGHTASALLLAKAYFDRTLAPGALINTATDFKPYQGYKGLYYVFRVNGTVAWRELFLGSRSWNSGANMFLAEKENVHFGPLVVTQFNMHPVRNTFLDLEVAKLWVSSFQGFVSVTGTVSLSFPGGGGVVVRVIHLNRVVEEHSLNDTSPTFEISVMFHVRVKDQVAFVVAAQGAHDYFCSTWSTFKVVVQDDQSHQFRNVEPTLLQQNHTFNSTCLPSFFIVGVQQCGTNMLEEAIIKSSASRVVNHRLPNFFMSKTNLTKYSQCTTNDVRMTFDKSPSYFMSSKAAAQIALIKPNSKILITVCDPAIRLWSLYHHLRKFQNEPAFSNMQLEVPFIEFVQSVASNKQLAPLKDVGFYEKHVQLWTSIFGRENVKVVIWQNFTFDVVTTENVLRFLDLQPNNHIFRNTRAIDKISTEELSVANAVYGNSWAEFVSKIRDTSA